MELNFDYTQGNHFKWGFGDSGWYNQPDRSGKYRIHLGYCTRPVESFRQECIRVAALIGQAATKPVVIGLSGGGDSQIACLSFLEAGVDFTVVIARLRDQNDSILNQQDISVAYEFCQAKKIRYREFDIDLDRYYRTIGLEYARRYGFTGHHTIVQCALMDLLGPKNCYVMAGGDPVMTLYHSKLTPDQDFSGQEPIVGNLYGPVWWQTPQPVMRHMMEMGYEGTSKYFLYTPEIIAAYLTDPICQYFYTAEKAMYESFLIWQRRKIWMLFQSLFKPLMINKHWPEVIQNRKMTGFEKIDADPELEKYYQDLLEEAADGRGQGSAIALPIRDLIDYVTTPHTHPLVSVRRVKWVSEDEHQD